jgi:hypothetical protein
MPKPTPKPIPKPMPIPLPKKPLPQPLPTPIPAPPKNLPIPIPPRGSPIPPPTGPIYFPRSEDVSRIDDVIIGGPLNPNDPNNPYKDDWNPSKWRTPNQQFPNPNDPNNPYKDDWSPSKWQTPNQQFPIGIPQQIPQNTGVVPPWINGSQLQNQKLPDAEMLKKKMLEQKLKSQQGNMSYAQPYFGPM